MPLSAHGLFATKAGVHFDSPHTEQPFRDVAPIFVALAPMSSNIKVDGAPSSLIPRPLCYHLRAFCLEKFVQLELGNADLMNYLDSLTAYGTDILWAYEKEETILWSSTSGYETVGLESLHDALLRESSIMCDADRLRSEAHLPVFKGSSRLSQRELKIVRYLTQGLTNREISQQAGIWHLTLKNCLSHIFDKLEVSSRLELLSLTLSKASRC